MRGILFGGTRALELLPGDDIDKIGYGYKGGRQFSPEGFMNVDIQHAGRHG